MQKNHQIVISLLFFIVLFAAFLRFYHVSSVPVSLYWDEAASTYNAYSIAMTGKDEYGVSFPLLFRSFDDYKASGNIYLTVIAVSIFGLNEFSARFTSGLAGTLTVLLTFFLVKELFSLSNKKEIDIFEKRIIVRKEVVSLLAACMLAISPWHIQFSRTGFEANVAVVFTVAGIWLFLRSLRTNIAWNYFLAMVLLSINFYFYRSIWVFLPLFLSSLFFFFRKQLFRKEYLVRTVLGVVLFFVILAPFIPVMLSPQGLKRADQVNVFTNSADKIYQAAQQRATGGTFAKVMYNQRFVYPEIIVGNYLANFSPQFLFISGDPNGRHGPRGMGLLYLWEIPFVLLGLYILLRKTSPIVRNILIAWILIAPIPAALSTPNPHALRDLNILPIPQLLTTLGLFVCFYLSKSYWRKIYVGLMAIVISGFFIHYLYLYYVVTAKVTSADWADGYKELVQYMLPRENQYQKLVVSGHYWEPYIYFLFYKKYDPKKFQESGSSQITFGKYYFGGTAWDRDKGRLELDNVNLQKVASAKHILVALSPEEYASDKNQLHYLTTIYNHNGEMVFIVGETK